jgi:predicted N-acetyltransferase YhbS
MDSGFRRNDGAEAQRTRSIDTFQNIDTTTMIHIADERSNDIAAREALLDRIMPERFLKPSEQLRAGRLPARGLAFVARERGRLVGSVRLWDVEAGGRPALLLGPLAVDRGTQGKGVGAGLMQVALARAADAGHGAIILVGDPEYYERFGFAADPATGLVMPGPVDRRRLLGVELTRNGLHGAEGAVIATGTLAAGVRLAA